MLTETAATKIAELLEQEDQNMALRVVAEPGGCAGLRYQLFFDDQSHPGDVEVEFGTVRLVVDQYSAPLIVGSVIDFSDTPYQQGFIIDNPNLTGGGGCGCGGGNGGGGCGCGGGGRGYGGGCGAGAGADTGGCACG